MKYTIMLFLVSLLSSCYSFSKVDQSTSASQEDEGYFYFRVTAKSTTGSYKKLKLMFGGLTLDETGRPSGNPLQKNIDFYNRPDIDLVSENGKVSEYLDECVLIKSDRKFYILESINVKTENDAYTIKGITKFNTHEVDPKNKNPQFIGEVQLTDRNYKIIEGRSITNNYCSKDLSDKYKELLFK